MRLRPYLVVALLLTTSQLFAQRPIAERIKLPPGFEITLFADKLPNARSIALGRGEYVFVSTRSAGRVYAIRHKDGRATQTVTIANGLNMPNGVSLRDGALYVAEVNRILRYDDIEKRLEAGARLPQPVVVTDRFPKDTHHGWKFIRFGPDGLLYVPVGAPCNICEPDVDRYALIARIRPDGSNYEVVARGARNSVGFDWHPQSGELWFTDNGRDWMGDELPSDELNRVAKIGSHFGYPYCHQGDVADPQFGAKRACSEFVAPAVKLGPHVAALGMRFYTGSQFPPEYRGNIFIAEHGSWNRSQRIGYRIKRVVLNGSTVVRQEVFAEGWLDGDYVSGRPVDIEIMPDGSMLVSDDHAGTIYRISYRGK
ncbi:MAG: PQQ-dependent sugar dehydrogenase [Burkholderiales bacterium]